MNEKSNPTQPPSLEDRVKVLEFNVARISEAIYDLIKRLKQIPDPPCPPMCNGYPDVGEQTTKTDT